MEMTERQAMLFGLAFEFLLRNLEDVAEESAEEITGQEVCELYNKLCAELGID